MCYPVKCAKCGKTTWAGCGLHKEMVMSRIPPEERCTCAAATSTTPPPGSEPTKTATSPAPAQGEIRHLTSTAELQERLAAAGNKLVVVDYYATWCAPCKAMAPHFARWANTFGERAWFFKVNGEEHEQMVLDNGVSAFPTFMLYKFGKVCDSFSGVDVRGIEAAIERNL